MCSVIGSMVSIPPVAARGPVIACPLVANIHGCGHSRAVADVWGGCNSMPLEARRTNLALEMRRAGYEPALVGYTTTTPDPRVTPPEDPRFRNLGALMPGWYPVGPWEPEKAHYFNWLRDRGFALPEVP